jgi:putative membrane protein insertion efficiency factor
MKAVMAYALRGYKRWISPLLPNACRFVQTCSEYALEAVERHGALRGTWLAFTRVFRCHPFARAGYDTVPHASRESFAFGVIRQSSDGSASAASVSVCHHHESRPHAGNVEN